MLHPMAQIENIIAGMVKLEKVPKIPTGDMKTPRISFPIPEGFKLPDEVRRNIPFVAQATFRIDEAGLIELLQMDGQDVFPRMATDSETSTNQTTPFA